MDSKFIQEINTKLQKELDIKNPNALPRLQKVVINYRIADSRDSQEAQAAAQKEIMAITGQKPQLLRSKKSYFCF